MRRGSVLVLSTSALIVGVLLGSCGNGRRNNNNGGGGDGGDGSCTGLQCYQMDCGGGTPTTLTGTVYAPNGIDPVYDAQVYVPTTLAEFPKGVQCEACSEPPGGTPLVSVNTAVDGTFTLTNVPATRQVPIVVQKGRFRRVFNLDVTPCTTTPLSKDQTRLPRNQQEGDLPQIAVGVGNYDQIECVLRSIGIDEAEFTSPGGSGAVHLYKNYTNFGGGGSVDELGGLLGSADKLNQYNLLFVNCTDERAEMQPGNWKQNLFQYVNSGGRLYVTDWAYDYMEQVQEFAPYIFFEGSGTETAPQPPGTAFYAWSGQDLKGTLVDPTLAAWMKAAGASSDGTLNIIGSWALANHVSMDTKSYPTHTWVQGAANGVTRPFTATFDYNMCGKVLWSSYHTQEPGGGGFDTGPGGAFPAYCKSTPTTMIPQEKVLEFLIFQISSCVTPVM